MPVWSADVSIDEPLVRRLLREQFPPLPRRSVELLGEGWDYAVYRIDGEWTFRFPRREAVVPGTEREIAVLPRLAPLLPVAVPAPTFVGRPSDAFPWPFYGAPHLAGTEARGGTRSLVHPLAQALRALHSAATFAVAGELVAPDANRRADMELRVPRTRTELAELETWHAPPLVDDVLVRAEQLPPPRQTAVCHGDLHFRQLLTDRDELTGIVDWVDVCRSDPAIDLQVYWSVVPPDARPAFLDEYGPASEETLLRARVVALFLAAAIARYARAEGLRTIEAEALAALDRTVTG